MVYSSASNIPVSEMCVCPSRSHQSVTACANPATWSEVDYPDTLYSTVPIKEEFSPDATVLTWSADNRSTFDESTNTDQEERPIWEMSPIYQIIR